MFTVNESVGLLNVYDKGSISLNSAASCLVLKRAPIGCQYCSLHYLREPRLVILNMLIALTSVSLLIRADRIL